MIIVFEDLPNFRIVVDDQNHTVEERVIVQDTNSKNFGKERWNKLTYHPNVGQACLSLSRRIVGNTEAVKNIQEFQEFMLDIEQKIRKISIIK